MKWDWIAGVVVVSGMILGFTGLLGYGVWDVVRQYHQDPGATTGALSITASSWLMAFSGRHPFVLAYAFFSLGTLTGHLFWPQVRRT